MPEAKKATTTAPKAVVAPSWAERQAALRKWADERHQACLSESKKN